MKFLLRYHGYKMSKLDESYLEYCESLTEIKSTPKWDWSNINPVIQLWEIKKSYNVQRDEDNRSDENW